jgi:tryptophanyl-tRNA synthetase
LNQLLLPFLSLISVAELRRNPTVKEEIDAAGRSTVSGLMFTYPAHQAADILFGKANLVPVGRDQLPHLELTRTIARRFNERYAPIFPEPEPLLSQAPLLLGTDGRKMGKSRGNSIILGATEDETAALIRRARTDAERTVTFEPERRPEVSNLVLLAALSQDRDPHEVAAQIGSAGAAGLKQLVTEALNDHLAPIRERRRMLLADPAYLRMILRRGNERAREMAVQTLDQVRDAMRMRY